MSNSDDRAILQRIKKRSTKQNRFKVSFENVVVVVKIITHVIIIIIIVELLFSQPVISTVKIGFFLCLSLRVP